MAKNVLEVTDNSFKSEVLDSSMPVLVDFWAPWCGPCRMVAPVVEELSGELSDKMKFTKLNVDENQGVAAQFGIMAIPSLLIFKGGQVAQQHVGALSKSALKGIIDKVL
jgi:thioredoxin 1